MSRVPCQGRVGCGRDRSARVVTGASASLRSGPGSLALPEGATTACTACRSGSQGGPSPLATKPTIFADAGTASTPTTLKWSRSVRTLSGARPPRPSSLSATHVSTGTRSTLRTVSGTASNGSVASADDLSPVGSLSGGTRMLGSTGRTHGREASALSGHAKWRAARVGTTPMGFASHIGTNTSGPNLVPESHTTFRSQPVPTNLPNL